MVLSRAAGAGADGRAGSEVETGAKEALVGDLVETSTSHDLVLLPTCTQHERDDHNETAFSASLHDLA